MALSDTVCNVGLALIKLQDFYTFKFFGFRPSYGFVFRVREARLEQIDDKQPSFTCRVREPILGTNPLNCLKTGTNTLADLFRAEQIRGRNESAVTPSFCFLLVV